MRANSSLGPTALRRTVGALTLGLLVATGVAFTSQAVPPDATPKFIQVAASRSDGSTSGVVLGVTEDGRLFSWGRDDTGLLGMGPGVTTQLTPTEVTLGPPFDASDRVVKVAIGSTHALALTMQGHVYAWGDNTFGQLGLGDNDPRWIPTEIGEGTFPGLGFNPISDIAVGAEGHSLALGSNGAVYGWGNNEHYQVGTSYYAIQFDVPQQVIAPGWGDAIAAGSEMSMAISKTGEVYTWGNNDYGQLAYGTVDSDGAAPRLILNGALPSGYHAVQVSAAWGHAALLLDNGDVYIWGADDPLYHQLGLGSGPSNSTALPVKMTFPGLAPGETITQISLGGMSGAALTSEGGLYTWGSNEQGTLALGDFDPRGVPTRVTSLPAVADDATITQISMGDDGMAVVTESGGVYGVGLHGGSTGDATISPVTWGQVPLFTNINMGALSGTVTLSDPPQEGTSVSANVSGWNTAATLTYQWTLDGTDISGATAASYTPVASDVGHVLSVTVSATAENYGAGSVSATGATVTAAGPATAPSITSFTLDDIDAGDYADGTVVATGTGPLTFTATGLPADAEIDPDSGEIWGMVTVAGTYSVTVRVTNAQGYDEETTTFTVSPDDVSRFVLAATDTSPDDGDTVTITALGYDQFNNLVRDVTDELDYDSSNPADTLVDNVVTLSGPGSRTITATGFEGTTASIVLAVPAGELAHTGPLGMGMGMGILALVLVGAGAVLVRTRQVRNSLEG